jgi:hypothetical protein
LIHEEVLYRVKEDRDYPTDSKESKADWICHILHRNFLLQHVVIGNTEGKVEVTGRQGRRHKQPLDDLEE